MAQISIILNFSVICSSCGAKLDVEIKQESIEDAKHIEVKPCLRLYCQPKPSAE